MATELIAGLGAIKTAFDLAKGLKDIHDVAAHDRAVIELQKEILAAQAAQFALVDRVRDLEEKVARFEAWEAEKQRYKLTDFGAGTFAYLLKPEAANGEPSHRLCAHCYNDGHKSVLQFSARSQGQDYFDCLRCKARQAFGAFRDIPDGGGGYSRESYYD